jgi:UBA-like domain
LGTFALGRCSNFNSKKANYQHFPSIKFSKPNHLGDLRLGYTQYKTITHRPACKQDCVQGLTFSKSTMEEHDDLVANFVGITGSTESQALQMLEATAFSLEEAIELFFAAGGDVGSGAPAAAAAAPLPTDFGKEHEDDEALARRLQKYVYIY